MVVPAPTSIDLLKEHAIYDFGHSSDLEIHNFDYIFAQDQTITGSHYTQQGLLSLLMVVTLLTGLYYATRYILTKKSSSSSSTIREQVIDIEAQTPPLSHSQTSTPSGSPFLGREFLPEFVVHSLEDNRFKQS